MKKTLARYASKSLTSSAHVFASVLKIWIHSPEAPQELRK